MAWKEVLVMEERSSFVLLAEKHQQSFSSLCKEYGISRKTGYKWVARYKKYGMRSLQEFSRRPMSCPHKTPQKIEKLILRERRKHKTWGPKKIRDLLIKNHKIEIPQLRVRLVRFLSATGYRFASVVSAVWFVFPYRI